MWPNSSNWYLHDQLVPKPVLDLEILSLAMTMKIGHRWAARREPLDMEGSSNGLVEMYVIRKCRVDRLGAVLRRGAMFVWISVVCIPTIYNLVTHLLSILY